MRQLLVDHYKDAGPVLKDHGTPLDQLTEGDVRAIWKGCRRILAGEVVRGRQIKTDRVVEASGRILAVGRTFVEFDNAYDLAVAAYNAIGDWQLAWLALEGDDER